MFKFTSNAFMNLSIRNKFFVYMLIISIFTVTVFGIGLSVFYNNMFLEDSLQTTQSSLYTAEREISKELDIVYSSIVNFVSTQEFFDLCIEIEENNEQNFANEYLNIQTQLSKAVASSSIISEIAILSSNGNIYTDIAQGYGKSEDYYDPFAFAFEHSELLFLPPMQSLVTSKPHIPVVFPLSFTNTPHISGPDEKTSLLIIVFLEIALIENLLDNLNKEPLASLVLSNKNGDVLAYSQSSQVNTNFVSYLNDETFVQNKNSVFKKINLNSEDFYISSLEINSSDLQLSSFISDKSFKTQRNEVEFFVIQMLFATIIIAFLLSFLFSKTLSNPINKLNASVKQLASNNYNLDCQYPHRDELGQLYTSINDMSKLISEQINQIKTDEKKLRSAEIGALLYQINPHFLYNTLDSINWQILEGRTQEASSMMEMLSSFLRLTLSMRDTTTTLHHELLHAENYLNIINLRSDFKVKLNIAVPQSLMKFRLLNITLQPLIENCIKHAFKSKNETILVVEPSIFISAHNQDGYLYILVEDNGQGIDVNKVNAIIDNRNINDGHIGISNVVERYNIHYNGNCEFSVNSIPFYRNSIQIKIPLISN